MGKLFLLKFLVEELEFGKNFLVEIYGDFLVMVVVECWNNY